MVPPKSLSRISRTSLIDLALRWLENPAVFQRPYLACNRNPMETEEEDYLYEPAEDIESLRNVYKSLRKEVDNSKRDIIDRIVEGDWRRGLSLHQLAMIDLQHLEENDTSLRWNALKLVPLARDNDGCSGEQPAKKRRRLTEPETFPKIQPATFVQALKREISPLVKAHYYLHRLPPPYSLPILRLYITDALFTTAKTKLAQSHNADAARALYIALPDSCPYVYVAISGSSSTVPTSKASTVPKLDLASFKRMILEAIPKAFSRPHERYALESTSLTARSLRTICTMRGTGRAEKACGAYSVFAESVVDGSPLDARTKEQQGSTPPQNHEVDRETDSQQPLTPEDPRVLARFGPGLSNAPLDRFHVKIQDVTAASGVRSRKRRRPNEHEEDSGDESRESRATMSLSFSGTDVFGGLRRLAGLEGGKYLDLKRMPAWMTGELGVSDHVVVLT